MATDRFVYTFFVCVHFEISLTSRLNEELRTILFVTPGNRSCKWEMSEAHQYMQFSEKCLYYISIETLVTSDSSNRIAFLNCFHPLVLYHSLESVYCLHFLKNFLKLKCHNLGLAFLPSVWFQGCNYKAGSLRNYERWCRLIRWKLLVFP